MTIPRCIAIIPDGNRRWARRNGLPGPRGHTKGLLSSRRVFDAAFKAGVEHVVLWAASASNLEKRERLEIDHLFGLLKEEVRFRLDDTESGVAFHLCGAWEQFHPDPELSELIADVHTRAPLCAKRHITILFGYDGKMEVVEAAAAIAEARGRITQEAIRSRLWTSHVPDVDLLIRTGIEDDPHFSDLLLPWQMQNTQLYFSEVLWPDFSEKCLQEALAAYDQRKRRRGA